MLIRKRSFLELTLPLTVVTFVCLGTRFVDALGSSDLRWVCMSFLFLYLLLNKYLLKYINYSYAALLLIYLGWCISTTLWSEVPILSFSKSTAFFLNVITMISAGSLWVIKYGYERSFSWIFFVLIVFLLSGCGGGGVTIGGTDGSIAEYAGLSGNPNGFGFLAAVISPFVVWKLYQYKKNKIQRLIWLMLVAIDIYFLFRSYSRSSIVILSCVLCFFCLSLPVSKKITMVILLFFSLLITLVMTPMSYLESIILPHIIKRSYAVSNITSEDILNSRSHKWAKSYQQAMKGGLTGGGFAVTIGDKDFTDKNLSGAGYGREKGNSQFAIMEETGIIGLVFYVALLIVFFTISMPYFFHLQGSKKVALGLALGAILGLLMESIVEGWWDSAAGAEVICFWTFVGMVYGMIYLEKKSF